MKVTICDNEKTAVDSLGKIWNINGVMIKKDPPKSNTFYPLDDSGEMFAKVVCSRGLVYDAVEVADDLINII